MQGPDPPYSRVTQELKRSSGAVHKVCFTKQTLAPFHAAVIAPWFGCICREREATKEPWPQVLCIARVLHARLPRAQQRSSRGRHTGWFCKCTLGPVGTAQPHKCLLEAGVKVCSSHCSQLGFWTTQVWRYSWSLGGGG